MKVMVVVVERRWCRVGGVGWVVLVGEEVE